MNDTRPRPKLWEEMTTEEQKALEVSWREQAARYHADLIKRFWDSQQTLKILRDRPGIRIVNIQDTPASDCSRISLPQEEGHYLWYILDWGYLNVGLVQVTIDPPKHQAYLREKYAEGCRNFLLYSNSQGKLLTMYHEAHDHRPPINKDGVPWVDGYVPFDLDLLK